MVSRPGGHPLSEGFAWALGHPPMYCFKPRYLLSRLTYPNHLTLAISATDNTAGFKNIQISKEVKATYSSMETGITVV